MDQQTKAYLYAAIAVLLWSTVASAFKLTLRHLEPLQLVLLASVASVFVLFIVLLVRRKLRDVRHLDRKTFNWCLLLSLLNPCLYYATLFTAYDRLPAQDALTLNYSWPVMLTLLSVVLIRQKITLMELGAIFVSYFGVVVIATRGDIFSLQFSDPLGVGLALASTVIWALFWIFNIRQKHDPEITLFVSFLISLPILFVITSVFSPVDHVDWQGLVGATYVGLFEMGITFLLWSVALRTSASTAKVSSLAFLSPFLSLIFINQIVGEEIQFATFLGLLIIIIGLLMQKIFNRRPGVGALGEERTG
jgi:drug/metabolite transporter (DMT)-like permease